MTRLKSRIAAISQSGVRLAAVIGGTMLTAQAATVPTFEAKVDSRGFVDVWQLRDALGQVEPLVADDNTDGCYREGDEGEDPGPMTPQQKAALQKNLVKSAMAEKACATRIQTRFANYQRIQNAFNAAWMPALLTAVKKGDKVAEVILIRCDSSPVLTRDQYPSTCAGGPEIRRQAIHRLRQTGFPAAVRIEDEPGFCESKSCGSRSPAGLEVLQGLVLKALQQGNFGQIPYETITTFGVKNDPKLEYRLARNKALIEAASQDVPRAFLVHSADIPGAASFEKLNVNRTALRPAVLTWGPELLYGDGGNGLSFNHQDHWRYVPFEPTLCYWHLGPLSPCQRVGFGLSGEYYSHMDVKDPDFEKDLKALLRATEENITNLLEQDPRWGIFLMSRVGYHGWVPMGQQTSSSTLDAAWLGQWKSSDPDIPRETVADIVQDGNRTRMTTRTVASKGMQLSRDLLDVSNCILRYSGGSTPLGFGADRAQLERIHLGDASTGVDLLDPKKRYKQVLMQCKNAEGPDSEAIRFLLLAGDTMLEVAGHLSQRQYMRVRAFKRQ
nr:hypothetical protein [Rhodoferax sp.]